MDSVNVPFFYVCMSNKFYLTDFFFLHFFFSYFTFQNRENTQKNIIFQEKEIHCTNIDKNNVYEKQKQNHNNKKRRKIQFSNLMRMQQKA